MPARDLCTLADVKGFLASDKPASDDRLATLITQCSADILLQINRGILLTKTYTERRNGTGSNALMLRNWPVHSISSVTIDGISIPKSPDGIAPGFILDDDDIEPPGAHQSVILINRSFHPGRSNVVIVYRAGYGIPGEPHTIASGAATVDAPYGMWCNDGGVTFADGTPLTKVTGTPASGQYALGDSAGKYTFSADDEGKSILISYDYVPDALRHCCIELVAECYRYASRVGQKSMSINGNATTSYENARFTQFITGRLRNFTDVVPI